MCIIAIKCKGVDMPSEQTLRNMWVNNPHGAGIMYAGDDGKVYIDKGFMDWTSFIGRIHTLGEPETLKDMAIVMHFRIATHGGINPNNTHPFPVSGRIDALKKLRQACKVGVAHNGIIPITPREGISDTMEFIASELAPLAAVRPKWYKDKPTLAKIGKRIQSKLAVLDGAGVISYYGDFIAEKDGMIYSNTSYKPRYSAVYTWRSAAPYEIDTEEPDNAWDYDAPWDTGRKSIWLMPVDECDCGEVEYVGTNRCYVEDTYDLWASPAGNVYGIDYDSAVAYRLENMRCSKAPFFSYRDAVKFEDGGAMHAWPF